jgi:hypothetical protein
VNKRKDDGTESIENIHSHVRLFEITETLDGDGSAGIRLAYRSYDRQLDTSEHRTSDPAPSQTLLGQLSNLTTNLRADKQGRLVAYENNVEALVGATRAQLVPLYNEVEFLIKLLTIPLPNREVVPGETWKVDHRLPLAACDSSVESTALTLTCTYLGSRSPGGRREAVVGLRGRLQDMQSVKSRVLGQLDGTAVVDLNLGQVTQVDSTLVIDAAAKLLDHPDCAGVTWGMHLRRIVPIPKLGS